MNSAILLLALIVVVAAAIYFYALGLPGRSATPVQCGTVVSHGNYQIPYSNNSTADAQCFYHAIAGGNRATLNLRFMGVDNGVVHNFTALANSTIQDRVTSYSVSIKGANKTYTYQCNKIGNYYNSTTSLSGLLIFGCSGEGEIFIPYR